ncbi:disease resistance protein PIK5-NP-like [Lolium rigidum]|uniref:disease resistance protein PIK5-NP-like n=1 Tax=Lolium rigidum TaxID=89674 RepID=UPI001F5D5349|nr:disease resistance protein PIK5-NP-like [Lolium rigidum]
MEMEEAPVTAATGALGPVVAKLGALLVRSEYKLGRRTRKDVEFIHSKFKSMHSLLWAIWEREDRDAASKELRMEAWDLADDTDDAVDDFVLTLQKHITKGRIQLKTKERPFLDIKKRACDVWKRCRRQWKETTPGIIPSLFSRKKATASKPRAYPFVRKDAAELVCMEEPRDELVLHLVGKEESTPLELQLKMASIVGMAGMGKTTLARLVYEAIGNKFQVRAFVSVNPGGSMKEVLASILEQVGADSTAAFAGSQAASEVDHLIQIIWNRLKDQRFYNQTLP